MTLDAHGRAHQPAGSPASSGGQYAQQPSPAAAADLFADDQAAHEAEQARIDRALQRLGTSRDELRQLFQRPENVAIVDGDHPSVAPFALAATIADRFGPDVVHAKQLENALNDPHADIFEPSHLHSDYEMGEDATVDLIASYLSKPRPVSDPDDEKPPSWDGNGHVMGPEYQHGKVHDIRRTWATGNPAIPFVTYTDQYVISARDGDGNEVAEDDVARILKEQADWDAERAEQDEPEEWSDDSTRPVIQFFWEDSLEVIEHRVRDDVGGSEIDSDYIRGEGSQLHYPTFEKAEASLKQTLSGLDWEPYDLNDYTPTEEHV